MRGLFEGGANSFQGEASFNFISAVQKYMILSVQNTFVTFSLFERTLIVPEKCRDEAAGLIRG